MIRITSSVLAAVVLLAAGAAVQAAYVPLLQNTTTGEAILFDNFESYDLHSAPNNCGPAAATWGAPVGVGEGTGNAVGIWQNTYGTLTGGEGGQCLLLDRGTGGGCSITGYGDAGLSNAGDTVKATMLAYTFNSECSVYLNQGDTQLVQIGIYGGTGTTPGHIKVVDPTGASWIDTGLTISGDAAPVWSKLEVTHVNGTDQFAISVNGSAPFVATGYAAGNLNAILFQPDDNHATGLFDAAPAVPEPSTIVLLGSGLVGLLAYAWRKRN